MKTIRSIFSVIFIVSALLINGHQSYGQEQSATMEKAYSISSSTELSFNCYDSDLILKTWDRSQVKLTGKITVRGGDKSDRETVIKAFQNPDSDESPGNLRINTRFYKSYSKTPFGSRIKLNNNEKASINDFTAKYTLYIPRQQDIDLKCKYNKIEMDDLSGNVKMDIYNGEIKGGDFGEKYNIKLTYSKAQLKNGQNGELTLYDSDAEFGSTGNLELSSKYSELEIQKAGDIEIESYDDQVNIRELKNIEGEAKYTEFELNSNIEKVKLTLYDCELETEKIKVFELDSKYSDIDAGIIGLFDADELYDNEINAEGVVDFNCNESKYDNFVFGSVQEKVQFETAYDSDFKTENVSDQFKSFSGEFKYCSIDLPLPESLQYKLEFESKYGSVDFNDSRFTGTIQSIKKNDDWKYEGSTSANPDCIIHFTSYDSDLEFD